MKFFRNRRARKFGIPFRDRMFWPSYHINFRNPVGPGIECLKEIYDAKYRVGSVAPIFRSNGFTHFYRIKRTWHADGDDHIVSPRQWDIEYRYSRPTTPPAGGEP